MNLKQLTEETEDMGIEVLFVDLPESKGRHEIIEGTPFIFLDPNLDEIEAINVLLHERSHYLNDDTNNTLSYVPTYARRIENQAEKDRIKDFMYMINEEFPIDEHFNLYDYMDGAKVPAHYENYVQTIAEELYYENIEKGII